jgi:regulator of replication initiation timing
MERGIKKNQANAKLATSLDSYRRLVELQKEMIRLAKQNERARRECSELRERVAVEVITRMNARRKVQPKAEEALKKSPVAVTEKSNIFSLLVKQS